MVFNCCLFVYFVNFFIYLVCVGFFFGFIDIVRFVFVFRLFLVGEEVRYFFVEMGIEGFGNKGRK